MAREEYLKRKNTSIVVLFIILCISVYVTLLTSPAEFSDKLLSAFRDLRAKDSITVVLSPILVLVFAGIISPENKARLVFWRFKNALPGHRVFTSLAASDSRLSMKELSIKLGSIPEEPREQNTVWYSIYKHYSDAVIVREAHRFFLLARDLCSIAFLFAILGSPGILIFQQEVTWALTHLALMSFLYLVLALVARNHGNRLVCNVLAEYLNDEEHRDTQ